MRGWGIYWLIGCILFGSGIGLRARKCPDETMPSAVELVAGIAAWPAMLTAIIIEGSDPKACKP